MAQNQPPEKTDESPLARRIRQELRKKTYDTERSICAKRFRGSAN